MNLDHIRYALSVADEGSFSAAARVLNVTQPTVSNAVRHLEEQLGGPLFRRTTRALALTPFGQTMLPVMRNLLSAQAAVYATADAFHRPEQAILRLGFSPIVGARSLSKLVGDFQSQVEVVYKECSVSDLSERLQDGRLDVVFGLQSNDEFADKRLALGRDLLRYIAPGAPMTESDTVALQDVHKERIALSADACGLASATRAFFRESSLSPVFYSGEAISYPVLEEWAELGIGGAILPESRIRGDASRFPVLCRKGKSCWLAFEARWTHGAAAKAHVRAFLKHLRIAAPPKASQAAWLAV